MAESMMATDLLARLKRHYIKPGELMPGGMFLPEVTLGSRRADALYVGFFASRGKFLVGHELKVSRSDWLHELDQPGKADVWASECHQWFAVAPSTEIVRPEELPHGWGLMVPGRSKTRMEIVVKAALDENRQPSWEATHALVQRADSLRMDAITEDRQKARAGIEQELAERIKQAQARSGESMQKRHADELQCLVDRVSDLLGFRLEADGRDWDPQSVGVEFLDGSFRRWIASDKALMSSLNFRVRSLRTVREAIAEAETQLDALRAEVKDGEAS